MHTQTVSRGTRRLSVDAQARPGFVLGHLTMVATAGLGRDPALLLAARPQVTDALEAGPLAGQSHSLLRQPYCRYRFGDNARLGSVVVLADRCHVPVGVTRAVKVAGPPRRTA
jgi:hypothetical protein